MALGDVNRRIGFYPANGSDKYNVEMDKNGDLGIPVPDYVEENVS